MNAIAKGTLIGVCVLALSGAATFAGAQRGGQWDDDDRRPPDEWMAEFLNLSEDQVDQLQELREQGRAQMADFRKQLMRVRNDIRGEMLEDDPDMSALKRLVVKKGEIMTDMEIARMEHRLAMRKILTEEQLEKLMMHRGRMGRDDFGPPRGGPGRGRMGRGRGPGRGGPMMGVELGGPGEECLGFGPGPYLWFEE